MTRQSPIIVADVGKLALLLVVIVGIFVLLALGRVDWPDVSLQVGMVVGYLVGNGASAVRRAAPSPVILPRLEDDTFASIAGPAPVQPPEDHPT